MIPVSLLIAQSAVAFKLLLIVFRTKYENRLTTKKWLGLFTMLLIVFAGYVTIMYLDVYTMLVILPQSCVMVFQIVKNLND